MTSCQFLLLQVPLLWQCLRGSAARALGGRRPAGNIKHILYRRPTSCGHRLDARCPADATIFGTHITDARPMPHDVRPMQNRPAGRLSEFPALRSKTRIFSVAAHKASQIFTYLLPRLEASLQEGFKENGRNHPECTQRAHPWFPMTRKLLPYIIFYYDVCKYISTILSQNDFELDFIH